MFSRKPLRLIALALAPVLASPSQAATMNFDTSSDLLLARVENQGTWSSSGFHRSTSDSYYTGFSVGAFERSFFSFKLSGIAGQVITGLELQLRRYGPNVAGSLSFFDVSTPAATLRASGGTATAGKAIYEDLGSGNTYGSATVSAGPTTETLTFTLNAQAVADANAALGTWFSIGGTRSGVANLFSGSGNELSGVPGTTQSLQRLVVTYGPAPSPVPLPAALPMLGVGFAGLVALRRRKRV